MNKSCKLLLIVVCIAIQFKVSAQLPTDAELYQEQLTMMGKLTGTIALPGNYFLKSRAIHRDRIRTREYLADELTAIPIKAEDHPYRMPNHNFWQDLLIGPFVGTNLYAILPATSPSDEYIVLGAHYDTSLDCPGANDNATGMVLAFSVTSMLSNLTTRTKNVLLVFFDQEEEDLVGSAAFAKFITKKKFSIHSVHTIDQMGWDEDGDRAIELELPTDHLESLYRKHGELLGITIHTTKVNSTDHHSFRKAGYQAVGITEEYVNKDTSPYKDTSADTFETVNFEYLGSSTRLVYHVIKEIITN